jgi:predicted cupin superfamily sugar epimerase
VLSDEVWCHLEGAPLTLHLLHPHPHQLQRQRLAPVSATTQPQCTVPAQHWQAAVCEGSFSLVACFVAPGFEFADFRLMPADDPLADWLRSEQPALARLI